MEASRNPAEAFALRGAAVLGRVLDDGQLEAARGAFEALQERAVTGSYARIVHDSWRHSEVLAGLVSHVGGVACRAVGFPELVLFHDHLLGKLPGGEDMGWHQDYSYLPLDRADGLTLWIPLDDSTLENGCLYYVYESHLWGERRAGWGLREEGDPRAELPPIEAGPLDGEAAPLPAGWGIAHHANLWHRAPVNRSSEMRRTWILSFVAPEARWSPRHAPHPRSAVMPKEEGEELEEDLLRVVG